MKVKAVIYLLAREGMGSKRYIINFGISTSIEIDGDGAAECIRRLPTRSMPDGFVSYDVWRRFRGPNQAENVHEQMSVTLVVGA